MLRIRRYLKPYMAMLVACIILLFTQAMLDLTLPDLLSRIVNTGIQMAGIENAVMTAMRQETMERITLFMSDDDAARVREAYNLVDSISPNYAQEVQTYPLLAEEPILILRDLNQEELDALVAPMARSLVVISAMEQAMANPENAARLGGGDFDLSRIPPGMDLLSVIDQLPASQRQQIAASIDERFAALGEKMINQTAVVPGQG